MKKLFIAAFFIAGLAFQGQAQEIADHALGLRFGGSNGYGAEVSYQKGLGLNNRLEVDLGWRNDENFEAFKLTGLYQWVWNIDGGLNWYAGLGAGLGSVSFDDNREPFDTYDDEFFVFGAGNIGIEYNFNIPLLISLDFRPEIGTAGNYNNDLDLDIALGLRYQF